MRKIQLSDGLQNSNTNLKQILEEKPDTWFHQPRGYLSKPDFKRPEQARANRDKGVHVRNLKNVFKSPYSKRYFVLEGGRLIYYRDKSSPTELGSIDLSTVERMEESIIHDAPPNSLDILTPDRCYTLVCETILDKQRWSLAISNVHENSKPERPRYQIVTVTFPVKELLYMNIRGVGYVEYDDDEEKETHGEILVIKSFQPKDNGEPGPAESTGKIKPGDQLIAVNETNLESMTFNEAVTMIKSSDWPLTMKLRRDRFATSLLPLTKDGWLKVSVTKNEGHGVNEDTMSSSSSNVKEQTDLDVHYSGGERHRRYLELRDSQMAFFKPTIGGSAMQKPEFLIDLMNAVEFNLEKGQYESQEIEYQLQIALNESKTSVETDITAVTRHVILTFPNENDLWSWASVIGNKVNYSKQRFNISLKMPKEISIRELNTVSKDSPINLKSELMVLIKDGPTSTSSGTFVTRFVDWFHTTIKISRTKEKQWLGETKYKIGRGSECDIASFSYHCVSSREKTKYRIVIRLKNKTELILASDKKESLKPWKLTCEILEELENIAVTRDSRSDFDPEGYQYIDQESSQILEYEEANSITNLDAITLYQGNTVSCGYQYEEILSKSEIFSSIGMQRGGTVCKSYMLKKGEKKSNSLIGSENLRRRYFILAGAFLMYYKDTIDCDPLGVIDLRYSRDIRLSTNDINIRSTEFAFEILSDNRVYSLATENEKSLNYWMHAIAMAIDAFGGHIDEDAIDGETPFVKSADIIKEGFLKQYIVKDTLMGNETKIWKSRYVLITKDNIVIYENEADVFSSSISPISTLATEMVLKLFTIVVDEETKSDKYAKHDFDHYNAFEVDAGIDYSTGEDRKFAFCARDIYEAKSWMEAICHSNGDKLSIVEGFKIIKLKEKDQVIQQEVVIYKSIANEKINASSVDPPNKTAEKEESKPKWGGRGPGRGAVNGRGKGGRGIVSGRGRGALPVKPA